MARHKYLEEPRLHKGDRVMLLALASGVEIGMAIFTIDNQVNRYGTLTGRWADAPAARAALDVATGREEAE